MELNNIKHHIDENIYVVVTKNGFEIYDNAVYITTIYNPSITRLIALQLILKDQETQWYP